MNNSVSLILASVLGLVSGMSHGVVSHYQDLPFSLSEQVVESVTGDRFD